VLETKGEWDGAITELRKAEIELAAVASSDSYLASVVAGSLGVVYAEKGEPERAVPELERALEISRTLFGPDHPNTARAVRNLAEANDARLRARSQEAARR